MPRGWQDLRDLLDMARLRPGTGRVYRRCRCYSGVRNGSGFFPKICFPICARKLHPYGTYNKDVCVLKGLLIYSTKLSSSTCLETKMKRGVKAAFSMMLLLGSVSAMAGSKLTAEECNDYPFKPVVGEVTHAQLVQELAELESVGYEPYKNDY
jgi:hypothetical protein